MKSLLLAVLAFTTLLPAQTAEHRLETMLILPEPKVLRKPLSFQPAGAELTVFTPAKELPDLPGIMAYPETEFKKFGLSVATFTEHAGKAADKRLATLKPDLIKGPDGQVQYAVYRDDSPLIASLIVAPALPGLFEKLFGSEIWVAIPDRHSLFIFPAKPEAIAEFTADLASRFRTDPRAASPEIFSLKKDAPPRVIGSLLP
jgi:hypothetical protein